MRLVDASNRSSDPAGAALTRRSGGEGNTGPLPGHLGRRVERLAEVCQRAGRWRVPGGELFVLPRWLAAGDEVTARMRGVRALRICVYASRVPRVVVAGRTSRRQLARVRISPRTPAGWRRLHVTKFAATVRRDLRLAIGATPKVSPWLAEMETAPEKVEAAAIAIWCEFLAALDAPRALRIPGAELSLLDLLTVLDGRAGGRDRVWFCNQWPAAAAALFRAGKATRTLREIDANRAMAVKVATAAFCCQGLNHCTRARLWARRAPRYCGDLHLAGVLAGHGARWDVQVRCILMHANENTSGALLRRLAGSSLHAREQAEFAVAAAVQPVFETAECRLAVGMLVILALAGSRFRPGIIEPSDIASAFVAVSADCLAAHCAGASPLGADRLEAGVLAFADMLSTGRPELSPTELFRFVAAARGRVIGVEERTLAAIGERSWPAPPGWDGDVASFGNGVISPLLSGQESRSEGEAMQNCLAWTSMYARQASVGNLALFSIRVAGRRATLALRPVERRGLVESYAIEQFAGPKNSKPPRVCAFVARSLVERLQARLPAEVPAGVVRLRQHQQAGRRFNADREVASARWRDYIALLPGRFRSASPADVVKASESKRRPSRRQR